MWINQLLPELMGMEESTTYMAILEKGAVRGALREIRKTLLLQGTKRFGPPTPTAAATVEAMDDIDRLEQLSLRLLDVGSWEELLRPSPSS
jgi:hypothetical protein